MVIKFRKKKSKLSIAISRYGLPVFIGLVIIYFVIKLSWDNKDAMLASIPMPLETVELPYTGYSNKYMTSNDNSPYKLTVVASKNYHYWVRVVDVFTNQEVKSFFIRAGETLETTLPSGGYRLDCASGTKWYGNKSLFGSDTMYTRSNYNLKFADDEEGNHMGHIITIEEAYIRDKNSTSINKKEFQSTTK